MAFKDFIKANLVLVVGLTLPIVLMAGFLVASGLPERTADPPKYSLVFSVTDFSQGAAAIPVSVRLVVQDGVLKAQYTRLPPQPDRLREQRVEEAVPLRRGDTKGEGAVIRIPTEHGRY